MPFASVMYFGSRAQARRRHDVLKPLRAREDEEDEEEVVDLKEEILEVVKDSPGECVPRAHHGADRRTRNVFW